MVRSLFQSILVRGIVCVFLLSAAGCRFLSAEEDETPFFEVSVAGVDARGTALARIAGGELQVWGQFVHPDSSFRFVQITLEDFAGEGLYALDRTAGTYGAVVDRDELSRYAYSSGTTEDAVRIQGYDADAGIVRGSFFFHAEPYVDFDDVVRSQVVEVSGRFRAEMR